VSNYQLKPTTKRNKKGWVIECDGTPINGGYMYDEKWKGEKALKSIIDFRRSFDGNQK